MPRKAFIADLTKAIEGVQIGSISHVRKGADDGEFNFEILPPASRKTYKICALVPDVSEYPSNHEYHVYVADDDAPAFIADRLDSLPSTTGKSIAQLLEIVAQAFARGDVKDQDGDSVMLDSQLDEEEDPDTEEDDYFPEEQPAQRSAHIDASHTTVSHASSPPALRRQIRSDLRAAKEAGFKVGHLGRLFDGADSCYVSVSCRISKLGISEEAMQAWNIEPTQYLILLIQYPNGYKDIDALRGYDSIVARRNVSMKVGVSSTYKPTLQEAVRAFARMTKEEEDAALRGHADDSTEGFHDVFISQPINALLNERLVTLIRYRYMGMTWKGAEDFYNEHQGKTFADADNDFLEDSYMACERASANYPHLVMSDHFSDLYVDGSHSFPLIAMQFFLRHFVRCTEFCLVCHCRLEDDLEALKPYVCDKPLCLYQYMSLGFGPSIEHEILTQPYVVDLLVSFCYSRARSGQLEDFPQGLSLSVPPLKAVQLEVHPVYGRYAVDANMFSPAEKEIEVKFDRYKLQILFDDQSPCPVRVGDWVLIKSAKGDPTLHCRVSETAYFPTVTVSQPIPPAAPQPTTTNYQSSIPTPGSNTPNQTKAPAPITGYQTVNLWIYNANFDTLPDHTKQAAICLLLETLPSITDMAQYLSRYASASLSNWVERISPAALAVLRWIIASNRSCIVQIDDPASPSQGQNDAKLRKAPKAVKADNRLYGMPGWMQFRFAMGAPDKERRFINAVKEKTKELGLKYPTLFAWHGSPLNNWHSIIRNGLHFNKTVNGRAFGNGVYMSLHHGTSLGYSGYNNTGWSWPQSQLKMSVAMSLNEVVNAPAQFISKHPHLVVDKLDWIQTRYLFVQCQQAGSVGGTFIEPELEKKPVQVLEQDPQMTPGGVRDNIVIPLTAISRSRRPSIKVVPKGNKKLKSTGTAFDPIVLDDGTAVADDDANSVATEVEDLEMLLDEQQYVSNSKDTSRGKAPVEPAKSSSFFSFTNSKKEPTKPLTDFVPGTLDHSTITKLAPPAWATTAATKRLQSDFRALLKTQSTTPLHELGWYIDPTLFENVYQWIIELHSFEPHLPLAKDMKAKKITSIVLELRFGKDYPMSPPFVRIVRPRFLSFMQGGGGHVTAGGALCMELLTNSGWSAVSSIESVLLQVRLAMSSLEPKPARLEGGPVRDYGVGEAVEAYIRACNTHGWAVPEGFREMAYGGSASGGYQY